MSRRVSDRDLEFGFADVKVGVQQITLEQKAVVIRGLLIEHRLAIEFILEARLPAEREHTEE